MKIIKVLIATFSAAAMLLASFGTLAACNVDVSQDIFTGDVTIIARFDKSIDEAASLQIVPFDTDIKAMADISYGLSELVYLNQKNIDSSGNVVFVVPFSGDSGKYIVRVHSVTNIGDASEKLLKYFNSDELKNAWDNLAASPEDNFGLILEASGCKDELILSFKNDKALFDCISAYEDIGEFNSENLNVLLTRIKADCQNILTFKTAAEKIKKADNVSEIKAILKDEENVVSLGISDLIDRYNNLKNTRIVDKKLMGEDFDSSDEFRKAFIEALKSAENDEDNSGASSSKGSSGTKGSSSLGTSINVSAVVSTPQTPALPFDDLADVAWAKEAISSLYEKNIVNGKSENKFAPNDYITREEFVKMTVSLLGLETGAVETSFSDVDTNGWYAPCIAAARKAGFITGYSDSVFGVGDYITREDVAVILSRIAKLSFNAAVASFVDEAEISDYAKEAVGLLSANGIINGSNGAFMPKSYSTRAETAVMIYRLSKFMKEGV